MHACPLGREVHLGPHALETAEPFLDPRHAARTGHAVDVEVDRAGIVLRGHPAPPVRVPKLNDTPRGYRTQTEYPVRVIEDIKKRALHRTKIIEGQLRGIEKMIENDDYCVDIITLSLAVQKSLGSLNKLLVENHLRTHVSEMYEAGGEQREAAVTELVRIFELSNNRG